MVLTQKFDFNAKIIRTVVNSVVRYLGVYVTIPELPRSQYAEVYRNFFNLSVTKQ